MSKHSKKISENYQAIIFYQNLITRIWDFNKHIIHNIVKKKHIRRYRINDWTLKRHSATQKHSVSVHFTKINWFWWITSHTKKKLYEETKTYSLFLGSYWSLYTFFGSLPKELQMSPIFFIKRTNQNKLDKAWNDKILKISHINEKPLKWKTMRKGFRQSLGSSSRVLRCRGR